MGDIDGLDGAFDRAMDKAMKADAKARAMLWPKGDARAKRTRTVRAVVRASQLPARGNINEWCLANVQAAEPMPRVGR